MIDKKKSDQFDLNICFEPISASEIFFLILLRLIRIKR